MASVECLEKLELTKEISTGLESRCTEVVMRDLKTAIGISKFVTDNCENINLVIRILLKYVANPNAVKSTNCRQCGQQNGYGTCYRNYRNRCQF